MDGHTREDGYTFLQSDYESTPGHSVTTDLDQDHDAASVNMGSRWRMPTRAECEELISNCTVVLTEEDGTRVFRFTSRINGASILVPAAGFSGNGAWQGIGNSGRLWLATINTNGAAFRLRLNANATDVGAILDRHDGFSVRGVQDP